MTFLFPALLFGALAASIPLAIHLIGRRHAGTIPFGAFDFLEEVVLRLSRRERIRQFVLMLLRVSAVALLALAAAAPVRHFAMVAKSSHDLLLVIDTSASMGYQQGKGSLLERAKQLATQRLTDNNAEQVLIMTSGPEVRALLAAPTADRGQAKAAINALKDTVGSADLAAATRQGLASFSGRAVEVVIISDLQKSALLGSNVVGDAQVTRLALVDAAERKEPQALDNVGITELRTELQGDGAHLVTVTLQSYSDNAVSSEVRLTVDNEVKARSFVELAPRTKSEKVFTLNDLPLGEHRGTLSITTPGDGYAADDTAALVLETLREPKILLVNGDPRSVPFRDELFYVERALSAAVPPLQVTTISHEDLASVTLSDFAVVLLANVPAPRESVGRGLAEWVDQGGGLFIALGDRVSFEAYNEVLGAVLPSKLRDQFALADQKAPDALAQAVGLSSMDWSHPIFRRFDAGSEGSFTQSHTFRHFFVENPQNATALLRFSSGVPALLEGRSPSGRGHTLLWLASLDRDFSDFAIRPVFSPFLALSLRYLGGALRSVPDQAVTAGSNVMLRAPAGANRAELVRTDGSATPIALSATNGNVRIDTAGAYAIAVAGKRISGSSFTVLPSIVESDFAIADVREAGARLGASSEALSASTSGDRPFEPLSQFAMLALGLVFVSQSVIARRG